MAFWPENRDQTLLLLLRMKKIIQLTALVLVVFIAGCSHNTAQEEPLPTETSATIPTIEPAEPLAELPTEEYERAPLTLPVNPNTDIAETAEGIGRFLEDAYKLDLTEFAGFEKCDTRWQFKSADWYEDFRDQVVDNTTANEKNIASICISIDETLAVAMLNGNVQETGGVVRYQIDTKTLEKATLTKDISAHLYRFNARVGTTIPMTGGLPKAKCDVRHRFNYEFALNTLKPLEECTQCAGEAEVCELLF